jgi:hypothetical protein
MIRVRLRGTELVRHLRLQAEAIVERRLRYLRRHRRQSHKGSHPWRSAAALWPDFVNLSPRK